MPTISITNATGQRTNHNIDAIPDSCPVCHNGIQPINHEWNHIVSDGSWIERVYVCPLRHCNRLFVGRYEKNISASSQYFLRHCVPLVPRDYGQPPELQKISPDFCSIFNQAHKAEGLGMALISGPGYRKALEFLIKDYLTSLQTTDEAKKEIADWPLMAVLKKYVTDKRMLTTAERATWLGNDETHYVRKWEDKDLQDMKSLIQLTCYWIQSEHLTNAAVVSMPDGKK